MEQDKLNIEIVRYEDDSHSVIVKITGTISGTNVELDNMAYQVAKLDEDDKAEDIIKKIAQNNVYAITSKFNDISYASNIDKIKSFKGLIGKKYEYNVADLLVFNQPIIPTISDELEVIL